MVTEQRDWVPDWLQRYSNQWMPGSGDWLEGMIGGQPLSGLLPEDALDIERSALAGMFDPGGAMAGAAAGVRAGAGGGPWGMIGAGLAGAAVGGLAGWLLGRRGGASGGAPSGNALAVAGPAVVKVWDTGTARFGLLSDGRGVVADKRGVIKTFRWPRHIVVSRNPRVGSLSRAAKRLDKLTAGLVGSRPRAERAQKRMKGVKRKR